MPVTLQGSAIYQMPPSITVQLRPVQGQQPGTSAAADSAQLPEPRRVSLHSKRIHCRSDSTQDNVRHTGRVALLVLNQHYAENRATVVAQTTELRLLCRQKLRQAALVSAECSLLSAAIGGACAGLWKGTLAGGVAGAGIGAGAGGLTALGVAVRRQRANTATLKALEEIGQVMDFFDRLRRGELDAHTLLGNLMLLEQNKNKMANSSVAVFKELERILEAMLDNQVVQTMKAYALAKNAVELEARRET